MAQELAVSSTRVLQGEQAARLQQIEFERDAEKESAREIFTGRQELADAMLAIDLKYAAQRRDALSGDVRWKGIEDVYRDAQLSAAKAGGLDLSGLGNLTGKPTGKITVESNSPTQEQKLQDIVDKLTTLVAVTQAKMDRDDRYANRNLERI